MLLSFSKIQMANCLDFKLLLAKKNIVTFYRETPGFGLQNTISYAELYRPTSSFPVNAEPESLQKKNAID